MQGGQRKRRRGTKKAKRIGVPLHSSRTNNSSSAMTSSTGQAGVRGRGPGRLAGQGAPPHNDTRRPTVTAPKGAGGRRRGPVAVTPTRLPAKGRA